MRRWPGLRNEQETFRRLICALLWCAAGVSQAHKLSDSYLSLRQIDDGAAFAGQWDIALRDLDYAVGIDSNHDGEITWGELKASQQRGHATTRSGDLKVESIARGDRENCPLRPAQMLVDEHVDGHYAVLRFTRQLPVSAGPARASLCAAL